MGKGDELGRAALRGLSGEVLEGGVAGSGKVTCHKLLDEGER